MNTRCTKHAELNCCKPQCNEGIEQVYISAHDRKLLALTRVAHLKQVTFDVLYHAPVKVADQTFASISPPDVKAGKYGLAIDELETAIEEVRAYLDWL